MGFWRKLFGSKEPELRCGMCGHVQREGEWEEAMTAQARAMGAQRFVNLSARPQCLACGSTLLSDASQPVSEQRANPRALLAEMARQVAQQNAPGAAAVKQELEEVGRAAVGPLIEALEHEYWAVRVNANIALQHMTGIDAGFDPKAPSCEKSQEVIRQYKAWLEEHPS